MFSVEGSTEFKNLVISVGYCPAVDQPDTLKTLVSPELYPWVLSAFYMSKAEPNWEYKD